MSRSTIVIDFNRFPEIAARLPRETSDVVRNTAHGVEADAKQKAPLDTGNLRNSIQMHMEPSATEAVIDIAPNRPPNATSATAATAAEYGVYQEYGTSRGVPPHPFMTPAAEANRPKFQSAMTQLLRQL
jgi:HK97 gp10 family phage protein